MRRENSSTKVKQKENATGVGEKDISLATKAAISETYNRDLKIYDAASLTCGLQNKSILHEKQRE